jgi:nicotinate-nucleotide pyrophosphorylase (carboxylating)
VISTQVDALIRLALDEDVGTGDQTTLATIPADAVREATVRAKAALVVAGMPFFARVFALLDATVVVTPLVAEGTPVEAGTLLARVHGPARSLLTGERTALNILQRLCGTATLSRCYAGALEGTPTRVTDTRKTTPGMRLMQKYAARMGGAANHRFGLDSGVLIKDNHIAACGSLTAAVARARAAAPHLLKIEVETTCLAEVDEAIAAGADVIMLDNMSDADTAEAVRRVRASARPALTEASGNMTLERLPSVAATGVDFVSVGALTHSAPAADIAMDIPA